MVTTYVPHQEARSHADRTEALLPSRPICVKELIDLAITCCHENTARVRGGDAHCLSTITWDPIFR
jgi:hypothetical protein